MEESSSNSNEVFEKWILELNVKNNSELISLLKESYKKGFEEGHKKRLRLNYEEWNQK